MKIFDLIGPWNRKIYYVYKLLAEGKLGAVSQTFTEVNVKTGKQYYIKHVFVDIPIGGKKYMLMRFPNFPTILKARTVQTNSDNVYYRVYHDSVITDDGTTYPVINYNEETPVATQTQVFLDPTFSDIGTLAYQDWISGAGNLGGRSSGSLVASGVERIVATDRVALLEFHNAGTTNSVTLEYFLTWYEGDITPLGPDQDLL